MSKQWVIDSGASAHMTGNVGMIRNYVSVDLVFDIIIANSGSLTVRGCESARLSSRPSLNSVLHTPENPFSLLSISQITRDMHFSVTFFS